MEIKVKYVSISNRRHSTFHRSEIMQFNSAKYLTRLKRSSQPLIVHINMLVFVPENICSTLNKSRRVSEEDFRLFKLNFKQLQKKEINVLVNVKGTIA